MASIKDQFFCDQHVLSYDDMSQRTIRSLIFLLLYAMEAYEYDESLQAIVDNLNRGFELDIPLESQLVRTAHKIIENRQVLDEKIKPLLHNWRFDRLGVATKLILRFSLWELDNTDTPTTIIINEAVELAKCFAEKDAYKFINGILDEAVKKKEESEKD